MLLTRNRRSNSSCWSNDESNKKTTTQTAPKPNNLETVFKFDYIWLNDAPKDQLYASEHDETPKGTSTLSVVIYP